MVTVVVERDLAEPVTAEALDQAWAAANGCLTLHEVRHVQSYLSLDGRRLVCVYEAPDAESVRIALRQARARPWDRLYTATEIRPAPRR